MKRTLPLVVMGLGLLLLLGSGWIFLNGGSNQPLEKPAPGTVPEKIAGLPLTQKSSGEAALAEVQNMHGKEFPIISGSIGIYGARQITVWIAGADSNAVAAQMLQAMHDKIAEGTSPFTPSAELQRGARVVYALDGMGQKHFYFQSGDLVVWLAADPALADQALEQVLEAYP